MSPSVVGCQGAYSVGVRMTSELTSSRLPGAYSSGVHITGMLSGGCCLGMSVQRVAHNGQRGLCSHFSGVLVSWYANYFAPDTMLVCNLHAQNHDCMFTGTKSWLQCEDKLEHA
eukprot:1160720-Pelagomonas_calceolata.AAC.18